MWMKWFPWRFLIRQLARDRGLLDPLKFILQFQRFAQPSEVAVPIEILRLALLLHSRGLINSQAIQHNLDWVWPYWVERQFDPADDAFIPRAFSLSHINSTHRNWTAVGIPGSALFPIVDPAGLVTPFLDSWSIDSWIVPEKGRPLIPSRLHAVSQRLVLEEKISVVTEAEGDGLKLVSETSVSGTPQSPVCRIRIKASSDRAAVCAVSLRPYNPEGVNFIHRIDALGETGWKVNGKACVYFEQPPERWLYSDYKRGDVFHFLPHAKDGEKIVCDVGMATAAAAYLLEWGKEREITVEIPLAEEDSASKVKAQAPPGETDVWTEPLAGSCRMEIPDGHFQFLYDAAVRTMLLHAPEEVYPGPYTYKHFWFRDAAFILHAMLCAGLTAPVENVITSCFFQRQKMSGYFHSQDGEWDSNGQALWTLMKFCRLTGRKPPAAWRGPVMRGAAWIERKRTAWHLPEIHAGLLPAGFSAEHLGPNDFYYWDDFWGTAGLQAAAFFAESWGDSKAAVRFKTQAGHFLQCIESSLEAVALRLKGPAMPASPYRRMDSGAVGSLAAGYPLQLWPAQDERILATAGYLASDCLVDGGFFHDMSHSGVNPYLTLHIAQVFLRAGNPRYYPVMKAVADLASPTGQWPEAIHPKTKGGCMGDGQHVWAAAEWVLMMRNCFVREEEGKLILFSGIPVIWLQDKNVLTFGPAPTVFGKISLRLEAGEKIKVSWDAQWYDKEPEIEVHLPGAVRILVPAGRKEAEIEAVEVR